VAASSFHCVGRTFAGFRRCLGGRALGMLVHVPVFALAAGCVTACRKAHSPEDPPVAKPSKLDGKPAPAFTLPSDKGSSISSLEFAGKSKLVLVFYRGYW